MDFSKLPDSLNQGIKDKVFSGAVAGVQCGQDFRQFWPVGKTTYGRKASLVHAQTIFDLASLTKVLLVTTVVARLVAQKKLSLDDSVVEGTPQLSWHRDWASVSVRNILTHQAGCQAWKDFSLQDLSSDYSKVTEEICQKIAAEAPAYAPGKKTVYSDLGFMVLGFFLERRFSRSLWVLFEQTVANPLECHSLRINPASCQVPFSEIAATEEVEERGGLIQGDVHDSNAYLMGGLAGHAGLFGPAEDCLKIAGEWLRAYSGDSSFLSQSIAREFISAQKSYDGERRALGWDLPSGENSSAGKKISESAVGHLGYTGTSLWLDFKRQVAVVLLTNRVHPTAKNEKIKSFRPLFHDLVWEGFQA